MSITGPVDLHDSFNGFGSFHVERVRTTAGGERVSPLGGRKSVGCARDAQGFSSALVRLGVHRCSRTNVHALT